MNGISPSMLSSTPATVNLDGRNVPPASMLTKGVAVAVDLCLTVSVAALAFYLISTRLPLDDAAARIRPSGPSWALHLPIWSSVGTTSSARAGSCCGWCWFVCRATCRDCSVAASVSTWTRNRIAAPVI